MNQISYISIDELQTFDNFSLGSNDSDQFENRNFNPNVPAKIQPKKPVNPNLP